MSRFSRTDKSLLGRWWWTVDRLTLTAFCILMVLGVFLSFAGSPLIAERIGLDSFYFVRRHVMLVFPSFFIMVGVSLMPPYLLRRCATLILLGGFIFLILTLLMGHEIKGARRWVNIAGFSLQASEFIKPSLALISAWLFAESQGSSKERILPIALYIVIVSLILLQPDIGMVFVITSVWFIQFFIAGLPVFWIFLLGFLGSAGLVGAYFLFPHVASRVDRFLDPDAGDRYQVNRSLEAFMNGGVFGQGPGEGHVKFHLPDAHADFIFAVAGEEFGVFLCLFIVLLYLFVMFRSFSRLNQQKSLFVILAVVGLTVQFSLQALINMASSLHLIPTKGMTLPFLSYGGSSLLALSFGMGSLLALTRRHVKSEEGEGHV